MKILFINDYSTPGGGAEILTLTLLQGLRKKGHDARLFSSTATTSGSPRKADFECFGTNSRMKTISQAFNLSAYFKLKSTLRKFQPDVVHVHMFMTQISPLILPLLKSIPALYHVNLYEAICPLATKWLPDGQVCNKPAGLLCHQTGCLPWHAMPPQMLKLRLFQRWKSSFNIFIAASQTVKQFLSREDVGPIEVIPNGVPVTIQRSTLSDVPTVSFAGHLIPRKGVDVLLTAFAKVVSVLPESTLLIAGHGPDADALKQRSERLGISTNVKFLGFLSPSELVSSLSKSWVHATPSIWEEPFGITSLEAMMRGTAVVASRVGGQRDCVIEGKNGFLVSPNDPESLASALVKILQDRPLAERMGKQAREIALQQYSDSTYVDRFEAVYHRLSFLEQDHEA